MRSILVPIVPGVDSETQLGAALTVARQVEGHNAVYLRMDIGRVVASLPPPLAAPLSPKDIAQHLEAAEAQARSGFEAWRTENGLLAERLDNPLSGPSAHWSEQAGPLEVTLLQRGRVSDLTVLNFPGDFYTPTQRLFDTAVFDTGRPVLLVPKSAPRELLRHPVIAWNGSLEATRAVAGALPLLRAAEQVSVFSAPWRSEDFLGNDDLVHELSLPAYLAWHGISTRTLGLDKQDSSVASGLLRIAAEQDVSLIVMGAYTRSRVRVILLGTVTREVLRGASLPVLMAH
jgi:hypothetical protein